MTQASTADLRSALEVLISSGADLPQLRGALVEFAARGGSRAKAEAVIRGLRAQFTDEVQEDLVLELLDLVTGWCAPELRVG